MIRNNNDNITNENGQFVRTCGSRRASVEHTGGAGGDGQSNDTYEPNSSHSLRYDVDFGG